MGESPHGIMDNVLDSNIMVSEIEFQSFQSYILDASGRSSVMRCLHCRFRVFLHHINSDSNPGLTLKEPSCLRDRDMLHSCLYQSKEKINKKPDFGRSYRHLSFSKEPMKTGHSTLLCYIVPSLPHLVSSCYYYHTIIILLGTALDFGKVWSL